MPRRKESNESRTTKFFIRRTKRIIRLIIWIFVLFLIIMGLIWVVPKVWHFVLG